MFTQRWNGCWGSICAAAVCWNCCRQRGLRSSFALSTRPRCGRLWRRDRGAKATNLPAQILSALAEQSVVVPATAQYGRVISGVAAQLLTVLDERVRIARELDALLEQHPLAGVLTSMPGVGARTAVALLLTLGDGTAFRSSAHLAAYAGLAPVTRQSGRTIRGERPPQRGNRALKHALYLSAFASLKTPGGRAYYDRKRAEGKNHTAALLCLARRRVDVLYAMVRDRRPYQTAVPKVRDTVAFTA